MQVVVGAGVGVGLGVGFVVGEGGADEGGAVLGRVLELPGAGVAADGWTSALEAAGLADALPDADTDTDAEGEELGRALPVRRAPAVGSPITCTEAAPGLAPSVAPGSPASGAATGSAVPSEWPEDIAIVPRPPPATRPTIDSTSTPRRRPDPRRLPRRLPRRRDGTGALAGEGSSSDGRSGGPVRDRSGGTAATNGPLAPQPGQDSAPLRWRRQNSQ
ncbi:hypothetical protein GCM10009738_87770 [Kitasatospora viridis]